MPFTPFHMGAALIVKPGLNRHFSLITFGIAQVAMDIEPGVGMLTGADVLHGPTHTILGALVIAYLVMLIAPSVCSYLLKKWNREVIHHKLPWLVQSEAVRKSAVIVGAFFGTLSHVFLDSLMHLDIHPLLPFSRANPLIGLVSSDGVYQLCSIAGILGVVTWLAMAWRGRSAQVVNVEGATEPLVKIAPQGFWTLWVRELRGTWLWLFFIAIVPGLLFGSAIFPMLFLTGAVLIGVPALVLILLFAKGAGAKNFRRLVIMVLVPVLAMLYVIKSDEQIPKNAIPISDALELFRVETGHYPDRLEALAPKHLAKIPALRFSLIQPRITYRVTGAKPYLAIASAAGDAFAIYEYDFKSKTWKHYS